MKKLIALCLMLFMFSVAHAADDPDPTQFRPLGRFFTDSYDPRLSPNGYYLVDLVESQRPVDEQQELAYPEPPECYDDTEACNAEWEEYFASTESYDNMNYVYTLTVWDIRGGEKLWTAEIPNRVYESMSFSPTSDTLMVKTTAPYPAPEEIRLTFYDTLTGEIISQTGDIDLITAPRIPGNLVQALSAEPRYTADGQHIMVNYWRRAEASRCAVWQVATADLIWEKEATCGSLSPDGQRMIIPQAHSNPYSDYQEIVVYDVVSGEILAQAEDEIQDYGWIDPTKVILHRPYGDPPILWDVVNNSRAVIELPYQLGIFEPTALETVMFASDSAGVTYFWDIANGKLMGQSIINGYVVEIGKQVRILNLEYDDDETIFTVSDLATEDEIWSMEWNHEFVDVREDGTQMLVYSYNSGVTELIDLASGEILGALPLDAYDLYITPDWNWLLEMNGSFITVWGMEDQLDLFEDQPVARAKEVITYYYEANDRFPSYDLGLPGEYLWLKARSADSAWLLLDKPYEGVLWLEASKVELFMPLDDLPVYEG